MAPRRVLLLSWLLLNLAILAWTWDSYGAQSNLRLKSEIVFLHGFLLLGLTMPSGLVLGVLSASVLHAFGQEISGLRGVLLVSLTCAVAGYFQWFIALPWLWRKWRK